MATRKHYPVSRNVMARALADMLSGNGAETASRLSQFLRDFCGPIISSNKLYKRDRSDEENK